MIRDDRDTVRQAARAVRDIAITDQYAGIGSPAPAFAMALILDEIALHASDLPDGLWAAVVSACRSIKPGAAAMNSASSSPQV